MVKKIFCNECKMVVFLISVIDGWIVDVVKCWAGGVVLTVSTCFGCGG